MRIDILSLFPEIIKSSLEYSIIKKALNKDIISINYHNISVDIWVNNICFCKELY